MCYDCTLTGQLLLIPVAKRLNDRMKIRQPNGREGKVRSNFCAATSIMNEADSHERSFLPCSGALGRGDEGQVTRKGKAKNVS